MANRCHSSASNNGTVNGGRLCGMLPTTFTPLASRSKAITARIESATATIGPALATRSAGLAASPKRTSKGFRPFLTQNRKPVATTPIAKV